MKYPWIEKIGLKIHRILEEQRLDRDFIRADCLEKLLENAQIIYGYQRKDEWQQQIPNGICDLKAKLLCIEPIKRGVHKNEILSAIKQLANAGVVTYGFKELAERIEKEGIID